MEQPIFIYKITNQKNRKLYIGQTKDPSVRWMHHKCNARHRPLFLIHFAMAKHGIENFIFEIIEQCLNLEQSNKAEEKWIKELNTISPNGYNIEAGGNNNIRSPETIAKILRTRASWSSEKKKQICDKISQTLKGIKHTAERRLNQSKARLGKKSWNTGTIGVVKPNSGSFAIGKAAPNKGRKRIIDEQGKIRYIKVGI